MRQLRQVWHFVVAVSTRVGDGHFGLIAAGVAFFAMFAVFPGLAAAVAVWGMFADPAVIQGYLEVAERFLPPEAGGLIHDQVMGLITAPRSALQWTTVLSLADRALFGPGGGLGAGAGAGRGAPVASRAAGSGAGRSTFVLTVSLIGALVRGAGHGGGGADPAELCPRSARSRPG